MSTHMPSGLVVLVTVCRGDTVLPVRVPLRFNHGRRTAAGRFVVDALVIDGPFQLLDPVTGQDVAACPVRHLDHRPTRPGETLSAPVVREVELHLPGPRIPARPPRRAGRASRLERELFWARASLTLAVASTAALAGLVLAGA